MPVENLEKTVEVVGVPDDITEDLLCLYFENKRRSGGGPLTSVEKDGDRALLVFEEAQVAAQVLSKGHHTLQNAELCVRKPSQKDQQRLLLCGVNPNTNMEQVELYVENMMAIDIDDYTLSASPRGDIILISFQQPFCQDFYSLRTKISKKPLDGSEITLEQVEQTNSILVQNLHPGITINMLKLYFECSGSGNQKVKEAVMLSEKSVRVSFVDSESVVHVLNRPLKLENTDLTVSPYFAFLQPCVVSQDSKSGSSDDSTECKASSSDDVQTVSSHAFQQTALATVDFPLAIEEEAEKFIEDLMENTDTPSVHIDIPDPLKCDLFQMSTLPLDIQLANPDIIIQIKDNNLHIKGPDKLRLGQIKITILKFFSSIAEKQLTFDLEKAMFLSNKEVRDQLQQTMTQLGIPAVYSVTHSSVVLTSLSQTMVDQASKLLISQLGAFSVPVHKDYECMLYSKEWSVFLRSLRLCSVKVSEGGVSIEVLTLKCMENETRDQILQFLSTPIESETVIPMEPGILKYIQMYCHQLLAEMDQVSIFPLEEEACGLKIQGKAGVCQMADEVLRGVVSSICTKTTSINGTGVARFLTGEEGSKILEEIQRKFQVYIILDNVHWKPLQDKDIFEFASKLMSHQNFQEVSLDGSAEGLASALIHDGYSKQGLIEEAKIIVSAIEKMEVAHSSLDIAFDYEDEDLYTADELGSSSEQDRGAGLEDAPIGPNEENGGIAPSPSLGSAGAPGRTPINLEEEAQLSLAIQYSMESKKKCLEEDADLKNVLELSKNVTQHHGPPTASQESVQFEQMNKASKTSLLEDITASNTAQMTVFSGYTSDLIRVDIALGKKVTLRQVEEKMEIKNLKNISKFHWKCVDVIKRKHAVDIQFCGSLVTVSGFKDYVAEALPDMQLLMSRINNTASDVGVPRTTVQWVRGNAANFAMTPYAPDTTSFLENAWKMQKKKISLLLNNQPHVINFEQMQEYNIDSGTSVKISREVQFPSDLNAEVPEDYSLLSELPDVSRLDESSDEFQNVVKHFYGSIKEYHSKTRIIKVEKLTNQLLFQQYKLKKANILQNATHPEVERILYHGTSEASVKEICVHGFNRSFCGKNATVYGQGVYFAVNSAVSVQNQYSPPNVDGHKFIFVAKVLTGDFTKGCHSMKTAPLKDSAQIPLRYDSVTDSLNSPTLFVIFNDTQAYPEYVITCQKISR